MAISQNNKTRPNHQSKKAKKIGTSSRAGLILPITKIMKLMKKDRLAKQVGMRPAIVMTAVCEYICTEILDLASTIAQENNKKRIVPRHLMLAISQDEELSKVINHAIWHESGVAPHIEKALLKGKSVKNDTTSQNA